MDLLSERRINYRELQGIAKKMNLPGNLKYNLLVEVIRARREGKEHVVEKILGEQKLERVRRKHEKLGSQESAYQHLCMTSDRGGLANVIVPRSYHHTYATVPNTNVNSAPNVNSGGLCTNNMPMRFSHHSHPNSKPWAGVTNIYNTDIRTVLQMPGDVFHNLHKKASEECQHRIQEAHKRNPSMSYIEWLKMMEHKRNPNSYISNQQNYPLESVHNSREVHNEYCVESETITPPEEQKKSFQMKDILNENGNQGTYGQFSFNTNQYDWGQLPSEFSTLVPENFIPQIHSYLPSMNHPWGSGYDTVPDSTYVQPQYVDYSIHQEIPSSSANAVSVSPQTSDTISATDEDLAKENNCEMSGNPPLPLHHSYISAQKQVHYLSQLDYEEPSTSNVPDLPSVEDRNQIIEQSLIPSGKDELDQSDASFIILDPSEEFSPHQQ